MVKAGFLEQEIPMDRVYTEELLPYMGESE